MNEQDRRNVVTVVIGGEEYTLRADASPDYTRECAAFVDQTIAAILKGGSAAEPRKAVILAALSLTDQLFQARRDLNGLRREVARLCEGLAGEVAGALSEESHEPPA